MSAPRLEINLDKIYQNASILVARLSMQGISVTGVTKSFLAFPEIATTLLRAGVHALGDSRIENIEALHDAHIASTVSLIRSPMMSQVERVVEHADVSFNTELDVIKRLSAVAEVAGRKHGIVLMIELGDLREGILPKNLDSTVHEVLNLPNIELKGIGTNLACRSGVAPDERNMAVLSTLANAIETKYGIALAIVSGGNSSCIEWALSGADTGRVNDLRLGEALLLGCEPLHRQAIHDLHTDAFTLVAEVIESKIKPSQAWGTFAQNAFGETPLTSASRGEIAQTILALGLQDTDLSGLQAPPEVKILGGSSDHLIVEADRRLPIGSEVRFQPNYSALVRAMTSPFVAKRVTTHIGGVEAGDTI